MYFFTASKNQKLSKEALEKIEGLSFGAIMKALRDKDVKVNRIRTNKDVVLSIGDLVEIYIKKLKELCPCDLLFEDENVLVIDKKSGFTSEKTFEYLSKNQQVYFIHRLDRNTSGVMIFAKNEVAEKELLKGFKNRDFKKIYKALVYKKFSKKEDVLTAYLKKDSKNSLVKIYDNCVKDSVQIKTGYKVIKENENTSELRVELFTGKTHQIRAHLAHVGHFILGDGKYGKQEINKQLGVKTLQLRSKELTLKFSKESPLVYLNNKTFQVE